jgi:hypothetical protein
VIFAVLHQSEDVWIADVAGTFGHGVVVLNKVSELKRVLRFGKLLQLALADKIFEVRSQLVNVVGLLDLCKLGRGPTTFVGIRTSHHVQSHTAIQ